MENPQFSGTFFIIPERFVKSDTLPKIPHLVKGDVVIRRTRISYYDGKKEIRYDEKMKEIMEYFFQMSTGTTSGKIFIVLSPESKQRELLNEFLIIFNEMRSHIASHCGHELKKAPRLIYELISAKIGLNWDDPRSHSGELIEKIGEFIGQNPRLLCLIDFIDVGEGEPIKRKIDDDYMMGLLRNCIGEFIHLLEYSAQYNQNVHYKTTQCFY